MVVGAVVVGAVVVVTPGGEVGTDVAEEVGAAVVLEATDPLDELLPGASAAASVPKAAEPTVARTTAVAVAIRTRRRT